MMDKQKLEKELRGVEKKIEVHEKELDQCLQAERLAADAAADSGSQKAIARVQGAASRSRAARSILHALHGREEKLKAELAELQAADELREKRAELSRQVQELTSSEIQRRACIDALKFLRVNARHVDAALQGIEKRHSQARTDAEKRIRELAGEVGVDADAEITTALSPGEADAVTVLEAVGIDPAKFGDRPLSRMNDFFLPSAIG